METLREVLSWILIVPGTAFCLVGTLGLLRMPEFYSRLHAASIVDTLGASLILVGLMLQPGDWITTFKLALILFFLIITTPTAAYSVVHAAYASGLSPELAPGEPDHDE